MQNIQNLILDGGQISKLKILFNSLNHVRANDSFLRNPKNEKSNRLVYSPYFPVQIFQSTKIPPCRNSRPINSVKMNFT